ncbi:MULTISPECIES: protein translocase subunit SecF [unclassified Streptomyces]|uniref:protein translocase subunit SecF n=1 Tax=unclassified Streptomyces TaxID=2593676 RepID=UPI0022B70274|nr:MULTISPECIES: protein translocase subunit SecF [unclassified Streptomyces]MCZ7413305.1 protein translocase subunit SecF [Streptomyces sp. WMMC897]MCZ7430299.1 protein translocase subunit SecF [Streptomyces sp. WMMC1477]
MSRIGELGAKLYRGEAAYDFVGRRRIWYLVSLVLIAISLAGLGGKGLFMGVEFQGGAVFTTPPTKVSIEDARTMAEEATGNDARVQRLGNDALRITVTGLDTETSNAARGELAQDLGLEAGDLNAELVGPSWGDQMTSKALTGMVIFLVLVSVYLAITFEWRMALAALAALLHDLVITVGVYALVGFEVTPGTVVGVLTILGYSLYDTVVVFDKVNENTRTLNKQNRWTFAELANRGLNATLIRSVNTSVVALLPVGGLLIIGAGLLGGGMLKDIALSLFVGLAAGTYSSIMLATPIVVDLKKGQPEVRRHDRRVLSKRAKADQGEDDDRDAAEEDGTEDAVDTGDAPADAEPAEVAPAGAAAATASRPGGPRTGRGRSGSAGRRR